MHVFARFHGRGKLLAIIGILSAFAATRVATAADRTKPTTPTNLRATAVTANSVSLAWNPSTDNSGFFTYTVRIVNGGQTHSVPQTQTTFTWTGLLPAHAYSFVVFATDGSGNQSANSNTLNVNTPAAPPLTAPTNVRVTVATYTSITLAWDAVAGATYYNVLAGPYTYSTGSQPTFTLTGLTPNSTYQFSVRAVNSVYGPWSAPITGSTLTDSNPPTAPIASGTATSPGSVHLTWTQSFDDVSAVGYNVYVNGLPVPAQSMLVSGSAPLVADIFNLRAATNYEFTVRAYDAGGNLSDAQPIQVMTPAGTDTVAPAAPANLHVVPNSGNGISSVGLMWNGAADNVGTTAYEVYMDDTLVAEVLMDVQYSSLDNFITVRHVQPGTTHTFTVKARDEACNVSPASNPATVAFNPSTDVTPPSAPTLVSGDTSPGCGFVDFIFNGSTDDTTSPSQIEYEIYEDGVFRGVWNTTVFEASFGRHTYYLRAVDRAGNRSAPSNSIVLDSGFDC